MDGCPPQGCQLLQFQTAENSSQNPLIVTHFHSRTTSALYRRLLYILSTEMLLMMMIIRIVQWCFRGLYL